MANIPSVVQRSSVKVAWLIVVEDPTVKGNVQYYRSKDLIESNFVVEIRGELLTKTNADKIAKNPNAEITGQTVNVKLPWQKVIRILNVNYQAK